MVVCSLGSLSEGFVAKADVVQWTSGGEVGGGTTRGGASIGASLVFEMIQMLDIGLMVASCGFAWGLLIALFMPPPAEGRVGDRSTLQT